MFIRARARHRRRKLEHAEGTLSELGERGAKPFEVSPIRPKTRKFAQQFAHAHAINEPYTADELELEPEPEPELELQAKPSDDDNSSLNPKKITQENAYAKPLEPLPKHHFNFDPTKYHYKHSSRDHAKDQTRDTGQDEAKKTDSQPLTTVFKRKSSEENALQRVGSPPGDSTTSSMHSKLLKDGVLAEEEVTIKPRTKLTVLNNIDSDPRLNPKKSKVKRKAPLFGNLFKNREDDPRFNPKRPADSDPKRSPSMNSKSRHKSAQQHRRLHRNLRHVSLPTQLTLKSRQEDDKEGGNSSLKRLE